MDNPNHDNGDLSAAARSWFIERVRHVPGVLLVSGGENGGTADGTIMVYVRSRYSEPGDRAYDLISEMLSLYPGASVDVWVTEARNPEALEAAANSNQAA